MLEIAYKLWKYKRFFFNISGKLWHRLLKIEFENFKMYVIKGKKNSGGNTGKY